MGQNARCVTARPDRIPSNVQETAFITCIAGRPAIHRWPYGRRCSAIGTVRTIALTTLAWLYWHHSVGGKIALGKAMHPLVLGSMNWYGQATI